MRACMDENGMKFDEGEVDELTRALFHDATTLNNADAVADPNNNGITFEALKAQLTKHEGLLQNLSISIDRWLVPPKPRKGGGSAAAAAVAGLCRGSQMPHQVRE